MLRFQPMDGAYQRSFGIALLLDPFAEEAVRSIWATLANDGITASLPTIVCSLPHLTAIICKEVEQSGVVSGLQRCARELTPFQINFSAFGAFPTSSGTSVFLQPTITETLLAAQQSLLRSLGETLHQVSPYYLPGEWTPHCSLGIGLTEPIAQSTMASCLALRFPLLGQVQAVALLEMFMEGRRVIAGCERARFRLGDGQLLPIPACPRPRDCPFKQGQSPETSCRQSSDAGES